MATRLASPHRFTTDEYYRMAELGIIPSGPIELMDGQIVVEGRPWRFSTEDYYRLAEAGILSEDERVELIKGEVIDMTPIGSHHSAGVDRLARFLFRRLDDSVIVRIQSSIQLDEGVAPQPDITILHSRDDYYADALPTPADVLLLIEVADTSVRFDRTEKADLYAQHGIAEYWLIDLTKNAVLVHTSPSPLGYRSVETKEYNDVWTPRLLPDLSINGKDIFG